VSRPAPRAPRAPEAEHSYSSGYGVALDLKMYLAVSDREARGAAAAAGGDAGDGEDALEAETPRNVVEDILDAYPRDDTAEAGTLLSEAEFERTHPAAAARPALIPGAELDLQATQLVAAAAAAAVPLSALRALAHDFPQHAPALARRVVVSDAVRQAAGLDSRLACRLARLLQCEGQHFYTFIYWSSTSR
jgi:hypothetical protein